MNWLSKRLQRLGLGRQQSPRRPAAPEPDRAALLPTQDTWAAIDELSQVVKNNPEAVEIYLALGNLYRAQGEIERAVQIRNSLIVRPGLDPALKARAWFQLGRDFRRGGLLDRAAAAFEQAQALAGEKPSILLELARLAADSGEFETAAEYYAKLDRPVEQAHYLVLMARELRARDEPGIAARGKKLLRRALKAYSGSVEAWIELVVHVYFSQDRQAFTAMLSEALDQVEPRLRFLLMEGLIQAARTTEVLDSPDLPEDGESAGESDLRRLLLLDAVEASRRFEPDVVLQYYAAWILLACNHQHQARMWLEKCLLLEPDFWLARLELFALARDDQVLTPFFSDQLDFFIERARKLKRFICGVCGLKREAIFFVCPKCSSWHSIVFRTDLTP